MTLEGELEARFPEYHSEGSRERWELLTATLKPGSPVEGEVVASYRFGVFLDIGVGFPGLLPVTQFEGAGERRFTTIESYPQLGARIKARVVSFGDRARQVGLTQLVPHPYLDPGTGERKQGGR